MELNETVIGTQEIFQGKIIHVHVDRVRLADGHESLREIVSHRGAVCIVPILGESILLLRQFRLAAGGVLLEIPAGTLDAGEAPEACAARELEEETGYTAGVLRPLLSFYVAPGYSTEQIHAFLATDLMLKEARLEEDERVELAPVSIPEIERRILAGEVHDAKTIASILVALRVLSADRRDSGPS